MAVGIYCEGSGTCPQYTLILPSAMAGSLPDCKAEVMTRFPFLFKLKTVVQVPSPLVITTSRVLPR